MEEVSKKTITVTVDQHESIVGLKRGNDTIYTVMDRLIYEHEAISRLEAQAMSLDYAMFDLAVAVESLKREMK